MGNIFGAIGLNDNDRVFKSTQGQEVIYQVAAAHIAARNAALNQAAGIFIQGTTEAHTERYKLPAGGRLQRRGRSAPTGAVKAYGSWDVAYPLEDFGAQIAGDDISMAYMTAEELSTHIDTVTAQNTNTFRFEMLKALMNDSADTFVDELHGSLTIQPLANGDSVVYPPVEGSESEATAEHYVTSGYAASGISDTNDPYPVLTGLLTDHFGRNTGNSNVVTFINSAQETLTANLARFVDVPDRFVAVGDDTDVPSGLPMAPGVVVGRHTSGTWIVSWDWIPAGYMLSVHLEAPAPLKKRVDPSDTGLPTDLALVARDMQYPFESSEWRHRFGLGVGNRLNGAVMELTADATYDTPTAYA